MKGNIFIVTHGKKERVGVEDGYREQRALSHGCSIKWMVRSLVKKSRKDLKWSVQEEGGQSRQRDTSRAI